VAAGLGPPAEHALISLLALNGLRVSEATGSDIEHLGLERGHRTLTITRKGGKVVTIPLAPRTARAIDLAIGERTEGPVFLAADGRRLDRHGAGRTVRKVARRARIGKAVTPHTLRHAFITAALDAGVPLRDVQEAASHADPRTTMRYDRARGSLDRHATYIVAAYARPGHRQHCEEPTAAPAASEATTRHRYQWPRHARPSGQRGVPARPQIGQERRQFRIRLPDVGCQLPGISHRLSMLHPSEILDGRQLTNHRLGFLTRLAHDHHRTGPPQPGLSPSVASIRNQARARAAVPYWNSLLGPVRSRRAEQHLLSPSSW
jgi:hypothetical protein